MSGWQIPNPVDVPANLAGLWFESSMAVLRTAGEFWTGLLQPEPARTRTSTASPWWMPPQFSPQPAFQPNLAPASFATAWMSAWPQELWPQAFGWPTAAAATPGFLMPWLPSALSPAPVPPLGNPFAFWQKMWLDAAPQPAPQAWPASKDAAVEQFWQPVAAAYRTANGHAMAAVLRTMADVVEPKPQGLGPAKYWPGTLGTRH